MQARCPTAVALLLAAATLLPAMGSLPPIAAAAPFSCSLRLDATAGGTAVAAELTARRPVAGTYALALRAGGSSVDQGGDFAAEAGETVMLGAASLSARPAAIDARLEVTVSGQRVGCERRG